MLVTGSCGLVGSEAVYHFAEKGYDVVGIDNDMRSTLFGANASTSWKRLELQQKLKKRYRHEAVDIRHNEAISRIVKQLSRELGGIVHTAAQPSHDWAARDPHTDFTINAVATLNLLEAARNYCPHTPFVFTSTNKVYGDRPNSLPLRELKSRWEIDPTHEYANGIPESMSIDQTLHSLFGVSKVSADLAVQEYGRYFDMPTACFRGGCLTGPAHSGTELHGFLSYLVKCAVTETPYTIFGYKGKQVRDNIHCADLISAFDEYIQKPSPAAVYNIGGGRKSNCSMLEAITLCNDLTGNEMNVNYSDQNRVGDHKWWISDNQKFATAYPNWQQKYTVEDIIKEIYQAQLDRNKII